MSDQRTFNVLFLCTGNSARSLMAEAYLNSLPGNTFKAYSAGSFPSGRPHPLALDTLQFAKVPTDGLSSKSWDVYEAETAPHMDFVFTVCDNAAGEVCPIWPGKPMSAHWPFTDPAAFDGPETQARALFLNVFRQIRFRIDTFTSLPFKELDTLALKEKLNEIGQVEPDPSMTTNEKTKD